MSKLDTADFGRQLLWTLTDAAQLLTGIPPAAETAFLKSLQGDDTTPAARLYAELKDATDLGYVRYQETRTGAIGNRRVRPSEVTAWALKRGHRVPDALVSAVSDNVPAERQAEGRYLLGEAALAISRAGREDFASVLAALTALVRTGRLKLYEHNAEFPIAIQPATVIRDFYGEALWNDLNQVLPEIAPPMVFRFPAPTGATSSTAQTGTTASNSAARDQSRFVQQEQRVLELIKRLGHDPLALPVNRGGKRGVKAAVRERCKDYSVKVFDAAWERLRKQKLVCDVEVK